MGGEQRGSAGGTRRRGTGSGKGAAGEEASIRFGGGDVGQLGLPPSLPLTALGVCSEGSCQRGDGLAAGSGGCLDALITTTGACILAVVVWLSPFFP